MSREGTRAARGGDREQCDFVGAAVAGEKSNPQNTVRRTGRGVYLRWPLLLRLCLCPEVREAGSKQVSFF